MDQSDLLKVFNSIVRPTLEYASPTFHSMLTQEMTDEIEGIQKRASKLIYGWDSNYDEIIDSGKMETLSARRERLTLNFARKTAKQPRFANWFKEKSYQGLNLRKEKKFEEVFAKTERLKKSPLYYLSLIHI